MFLGHLGIDRFYIGKIGTGLLKLLTFLGIPLYLLGIFYPLVSMHRSEFMILLLLPTMANTIWAWIDWFHLGTRLVKDRKGRPLARAKVVGRPRKEQALAFRLCCFVGSLGISDFYLGRFVRSLARLAVTFGPLFLLFKFKPDFDARATKAFVGVWMLANGIWNTVDLAQIGMGIALDGKGNSLIPPAA